VPLSIHTNKQTQQGTSHGITLTVPGNMKNNGIDISLLSRIHHYFGAHGFRALKREAQST